MRFGILGDIHGNIYALNACLKYIDKMNIDEIIWCGDYITDFPKSHEVINLIKEYSNKYKSYIIAGNREDYIIEYLENKHSDWNSNIRFENMIYTYNSLTSEDIQWLKSLPKTLQINFEDYNIYVSHKCTYENIDKCKYKIFAHSHKQCNFRRDDVKYINPGSVGINTDKIVGAEFSILELTKDYEKLEECYIKYDIKEAVNAMENNNLYKQGSQYGKLIVKELKTGIDYPQDYILEYNKIRREHHIENESDEVWNIALNNIVNNM